MEKMNGLSIVFNPSPRSNRTKKAIVTAFTNEQIKEVRDFHRSFPEYQVTPIHSLDNLAAEFGIDRLWLKDESYRFGLNSFKVLGGSYGMAAFLRKKLGRKELSFAGINSAMIKEKAGNLLFVTATDGNHGRGVAWAAAKLGYKAVVFMPKGSAEVRVNNIRKERADVFVTALNYDDTVRLAKKYAKEHNGVIIQDTAWEGYQEIPLWIMQGYSTIIDEALAQLAGEKPTHLILQAGVGSFAGSVLAFLTAKYGKERPITIIVEPEQAACVYMSALAGDGKPHCVKGDLQTIMAGLACGEPNPQAWEILRDYADAYISCPDYFAARGMRILANPITDDPKIISGESGAIGVGLLSALAEKKEYGNLNKKLGINEDSKVLVISTEGDTDPVGYRRIIWDGLFPFPV